jgi:predicted glycosyltransferase
MDETDFRRLTEISPASVRIRRFMADLAGEMARADLSISMAGYNTCMDILAAEVPALVLPFQQNREQRLRAERLAERGAMRVLGMEDLRPERLAGVIQETLASDLPRDHGIRTDGAERFARWVEQGFPETQENMER